MAVRTGLTRRAALAIPALGLHAQTATPPVIAPEPAEKPVEFVCPMDPDVRSPQPARCPRCGMKLIAGLPDFLEYRVALRTPGPVRAGALNRLVFTVLDPRTNKPVRDFEIIHEKLFHLFIVSGDLEVFAHEHPVKDFGPEFELEWMFPKPGLYRLMCDYYPVGGTPQITVKSLFAAAGATTPIQPLESNTRVTLATEPENPIAGLKTRLYFTLEPSAGLVPWLGAWGHLLVASADTVDLIHTHPFIADGSARMQFNVIFPRPGRHRVWVQFERRGMVNSARFDVTAAAL